MAVAVITGVNAHAEAELAAALGSADGLALVRRCADLAEVLAVIDAGRAQVALVSADLPGIDRSTVHRLVAQGCRVVGVHADESQERTLREWGVTWLLPERATEAETVEVVRAAAAAELEATPAPVSSNGVDAEHEVQAASPDAGDEQGRVIVVWGAGGAPGRSVVAANLAVLLAREAPTLLIDADTYAASQAQLFGILDEAPGIAAATRLAEAGRLDTITLAGVAPLIGERLRILTGLPRSDRWPELRPAALEAVLQASRRMHRWTIVDVAAPMETDEELSFDTLAPQRNAATRTMLMEADEILVLGSGDPIGLSRLVRVIDDLSEVTHRPPVAVVTKVRPGAAGRRPEQQIADALRRFSAIEPVLIPDDRDVLDAALLAGRSVVEAAPSSPLVGALQALAEAHLGLATRSTSRSRRGRLALRTG